MNKCLHVLYSLNFGGVETQVESIFLNRCRSSFNHHFCAIRNGGSVSDRMLQAGAKLAVLGSVASIPSVGAVRSLVRHIKTIRPQVVHLRGAEANFHGLIAARICNVPVVVCEEIGLPRHSLIARRVFRRIYSQSTAIIAISKAVRARMVELGEVSPDQVRVIYNPVEMQSYRPVPHFSAESSLRLGFVGRLEEVKNPVAAVAAVGLLVARGYDVYLRIVGDGSQRDFLAHRIGELGLSQRVDLVGFQSDPFASLSDCHIYLQPSLTEGFGLAICEAMSAGIPAIASAVGGAPEIIDDGVTGWLVGTPDAENIADKVEFALKKGAHALEHMGRVARRSVLERFSPDVYTAKCDALYSELLASEL